MVLHKTLSRNVRTHDRSSYSGRGNAPNVIKNSLLPSILFFHSHFSSTLCRDCHCDSRKAKILSFSLCKGIVVAAAKRWRLNKSFGLSCWFCLRCSLVGMINWVSILEFCPDGWIHKACVIACAVVMRKHGFRSWLAVDNRLFYRSRLMTFLDCMIR